MQSNRALLRILFKEKKLCCTQFYSTDTKNNNSSKYDYIVLGLGAMGSSTLYHLAKNNSNVLGLEQFSISHSYGSSHGLTRIIRLAYYEHPSYVDMLRRSYVLWDELEKASNEKLFTKTGGLDIGKKGSEIVNGSKLSCDQNKIPYEYLTQDQLIERFPGWKSIPKEWNVNAVYQPDAGILNPEKCIAAHVNQAKKLGATVRDGEEFLDLKVYSKNEILIKTNKGEYLTSKVVLSSGPWLGGFLKRSSDLSKSKEFQDIAASLTAQRNVVIWYKSKNPENYQLHNFPVFILDINNQMHYGFPIIDTGSHSYEKGGFKIGKSRHLNQNLTHDELHKNAAWRTNFDKEDEKLLADVCNVLLKDAYGPVLKHLACLFTNTPDAHFIIDGCPDPNIPNISLVSACSGHGFKFASCIGEIMATLASKSESELKRPGRLYPYSDIDWLRARRFFK